jgi:sensor histidine kinase YesM
MNANLLSYLRGVWGVYKRWLALPRILFVLLNGALFCLMIVPTEIADALQRGELGLTWQPWLWTMTAVYGYNIVSPFLIYCCEIWPLGKNHKLETSIKLMLLYVPFTLLFITFNIGLRHIGHLLIEGSLFNVGDSASEILDRYIYEFLKAFGVYITFVFLTYAKIYYDSTKKEQLRVANLHNDLQKVKMHTLRSQLQPHFLFNTLNLISGTVYQDAKKADEIIQLLKGLLHYSLATEQKHFVALREEMVVMISYLDIAKLRFGDRLTTTINIAPETNDLMIPVMLLQPLLENAVKFGIEPSDDHGEISLTTSLENSELIIKITNPWHQRRAQQESFGIGLTNTRNRLALLYDDHACVTLETKNKHQITLLIHLPIQQAQIMEVS